MTTENPASGTTDAIENNHDAARKMLQILSPDIHVVTINPNDQSIAGRYFHDNIDNCIDYCSAKSMAGCNVYYTINSIRDGVKTKPSKSDVRNARFLHVDIDPPKSGEPFDKQEVSDFLMEHKCPPSMIVDSGNGIQALWALDGIHQNLDAIENINKQIEEYYQADHCHNRDRLFRLPGFRNIPNTAKRKLGRVEVATGWMVEDTGETHEAQEVTNLFPEASNEVGTTSSRIDVELDAIEPLTLDDLKNPPKYVIDAIMHPKGEDRSADGLRAVRAMANAGYSDDEIAGIVLNEANPISAYYLKSTNAHALRWIKRDLSKVRIDTPYIDMSKCEIDWEAFIGKLEELTRQEGYQHDCLVLVAENDPQNEIPNADIFSTSDLPRLWWYDELDGILSLLVDTIRDSGTRDQPELALAAALPIIGTIAGRRYQFDGLRTNIYCVGLAETATGKEAAFSIASQLFEEAELNNRTMGEDIASGQGIMSSLVQHPVKLLNVDEYGKFLSKNTGTKSSTNEVFIQTVLLKLFSKAGRTYRGAEYANKIERPREDISQPCLSMYAATTQSTLYGAINSGNSLDGMLGRNLYFQAPSITPPQRRVIPRDLPARLVTMAKLIDQGAEDHETFTTMESSKDPSNPYKVDLTYEAEQKLYELMKEQDKALGESARTIRAVFGRVTEIAKKIALILAISRNPKKPVIEEKDIMWAGRIAFFSSRTIAQGLTDHVADNEQEQAVKRVANIIKDAGKSGITKNVITRKTQFLDARRRSSILSDLEEAHLVRIEKGNSGGRTAERYFHLNT